MVKWTCWSLVVILFQSVVKEILANDDDRILRKEITTNYLQYLYAPIDKFMSMDRWINQEIELTPAGGYMKWHIKPFQNSTSNPSIPNPELWEGDLTFSCNSTSTGIYKQNLMICNNSLLVYFNAIGEKFSLNASTLFLPELKIIDSDSHITDGTDISILFTAYNTSEAPSLKSVFLKLCKFSHFHFMLRECFDQKINATQGQQIPLERYYVVGIGPIESEKISAGSLIILNSGMNTGFIFDKDSFSNLTIDDTTRPKSSRYTSMHAINFTNTTTSFNYSLLVTSAPLSSKESQLQDMWNCYIRSRVLHFTPRSSPNFQLRYIDRLVVKGSKILYLQVQPRIVPLSQNYTDINFYEFNSAMLNSSTGLDTSNMRKVFSHTFSKSIWVEKPSISILDNTYFTAVMFTVSEGNTTLLAPRVFFLWDKRTNSAFVQEQTNTGICAMFGFGKKILMFWNKTYNTLDGAAGIMKLQRYGFPSTTMQTYSVNLKIIRPHIPELYRSMNVYFYDSLLAIKTVLFNHALTQVTLNPNMDQVIEVPTDDFIGNDVCIETLPAQQYYLTFDVAGPARITIADESALIFNPVMKIIPVHDGFVIMDRNSANYIFAKIHYFSSCKKQSETPDFGDIMANCIKNWEYRLNDKGDSMFDKAETLLSFYSFRDNSSFVFITGSNSTDLHKITIWSLKASMPGESSSKVTVQAIRYPYPVYNHMLYDVEDPPADRSEEMRSAVFLFAESTQCAVVRLNMSNLNSAETSRITFGLLDYAKVSDFAQDFTPRSFIHARSGLSEVWVTTFPNPSPNLPQKISNYKFDLSVVDRPILVERSVQTEIASKDTQKVYIFDWVTVAVRKSDVIAWFSEVGTVETFGSSGFIVHPPLGLNPPVTAHCQISNSFAFYDHDLLLIQDDCTDNLKQKNQTLWLYTFRNSLDTVMKLKKKLTLPQNVNSISAYVRHNFLTLILYTSSSQNYYIINRYDLKNFRLIVNRQNYYNGDHIRLNLSSGIEKERANNSNQYHIYVSTDQSTGSVRFSKLSTPPASKDEFRLLEDYFSYEGTLDTFKVVQSSTVSGDSVAKTEHLDWRLRKNISINIPVVSGVTRKLTEFEAFVPSTNDDKSLVGLGYAEEYTRFLLYEDIYVKAATDKPVDFEVKQWCDQPWNFLLSQTFTAANHSGVLFSRCARGNIFELKVFLYSNTSFSGSKGSKYVLVTQDVFVAEFDRFEVFDANKKGSFILAIYNDGRNTVKLFQLHLLIDQNSMTHTLIPLRDYSSSRLFPDKFIQVTSSNSTTIWCFFLSILRKRTKSTSRSSQR